MQDGYSLELTFAFLKLIPEKNPPKFLNNKKHWILGMKLDLSEQYIL